MRCCIENAEGHCQSYPRCEGCDSHITGGRCASSISRLEKMLAAKCEELEEVKKGRVDIMDKRILVATALSVGSLVLSITALILKIIF